MIGIRHNNGLSRNRNSSLIKINLETDQAIINLEMKKKEKEKKLETIDHTQTTDIKEVKTGYLEVMTTIDTLETVIAVKTLLEI